MAVLSPANCRAAIAALISTVPNSGRVHPQRRIVRTEQDIKRHLFDTDQNRICAWMISPAETGTALVAQRHPGHVGNGVKGGGNVFTTFQFQIEGIFGLDDAAGSEQVFADLAWAVADEFNAYGIIPAAGGGQVPGLHMQLPCSVESFGFIMYAGSFLCHYARLGLALHGRTRPAP